MSESPTYYDILGVPSNADAQTIRKAYLRGSLKYHPDKNLGNEDVAKAKFMETGEAYNVLGDPAKRASYDCELASGKFRAGRRQRQQNPSNDDFDNFMNMFDETVSSMSEQELNMAMGAAAVVGGVIGSIYGARAAKGNSFLSSAASMVGSAMASQAASTLVQSLHDNSIQRITEREEREAGLARGEKVEEPSSSQGRERVFQDACGTFQKMAEAAMGAPSKSAQAKVNSFSANGVRSDRGNTTTSSDGDNRTTSGGMSWGQAAKFATMAAGAVAEMQRASNQQNSSSGRRR